MNKRKLLTLAMTLCMVAILAIGGTLAYFSDSDADINVMTTGNIKIVQNETQRDGSAYVDRQALLPAVYINAEGNPYNPTTSWEGPVLGTDITVNGPDGVEMKMYGNSLNNEIDKIISVTNGGKVDAYVRTIVLFENGKDEDGNEITDRLHVAYTDDADVVNREWINEITVDGQLYEAYVFTYKQPVKAGTTSKASLKQIWLDPMTDNGWYEMLGEDHALQIIALSQATQVAGFEEKGAEVALNTAFGEITAENVKEWLDSTPIKTTRLFNVVGGGN